MKKKIEDYLHFYYGCEVEVIKDWKEPKFGLIEHRSGNRFQIDGIAIALLRQSDLPVKLLLRPLSDMTDDEHTQLTSIFGTPLEFIDSKDEFFKKEGRGKFSDEQLFLERAESFKYLLSRSFDLFDLIESGLAIDKTKIPA